MTNVALYARVSSEKQAENDLSIASQLKALRNYAQKTAGLSLRNL